MLTPAIASDAKVNEASETAAAIAKDFALVIVHSDPSARIPLGTVPQFGLLLG
jgi:hypothetical protein